MRTPTAVCLFIKLKQLLHLGLHHTLTHRTLCDAGVIVLTYHRNSEDIGCLILSWEDYFHLIEGSSLDGRQNFVNDAQKYTCIV